MEKKRDRKTAGYGENLEKIPENFNCAPCHLIALPILYGDD
jgi:hypothetical protein